MNLFFLAVVIIVIIAIIVVGNLLLGSGEESEEKKEKSPYKYTRQKYFLTRAEHECYDALVAAVGNEYYVFAQVHLPTIVEHQVRGQNWKGAFSHINRKSVDFVLCDKVDISPKLAIELDDKTHEQSDRQERDREVERILEEAGMPLLRLINPGSFDQAELAKKIQEKLASQERVFA